MATELWTCDFGTDRVYRIDASDGTVLQSFAAPAGDPSGVAVDLEGDLWVVCAGNDTIYRLNPTDGSTLGSFAHPGSNARGLAFDADGDLWTSESAAGIGGDSHVFRLDPSDGSTLASFELAFGVGGIAVELGGDLWVTDTANDEIKRISTTGTILDDYASPSSSPTGVGIDSDDNLWHTDSFSDKIYQLNEGITTLAVAQSFSSPAGQPYALSDAFWIFPVAPSAPTLTDPLDNEIIDASLAYTFEWDFADANEGDSQTAYEIRYRISGTSTWTTVSETSVNEFHQFSGGTFTAGNTYEWQVRTTDTSALTGPWSASEFFDAEAQPSSPTITDPTLDQVIASATYDVDWTTATQNAYRVRVVGDSAGSPDTGTVHHDSGVIESSSTRSRSVPFPTDGVTRHVQVQTRHDGLWSEWASVRVDVDYTVPATPTVTLAEGLPTSAITVDAQHPTPSGTEPTVDSMDVQRSPSGEDDWTTIAAGLDPTDTYADYAVAGGALYDYRIVARASSNGTSSTSAEATGSVTLSGVWMHDPTDPSGTIIHLPANRDGGTDTRTIQAATNRYAGREYPVAEFGEHTDHVIDVDVHLRTDLDEDDDLRTLVDRRAVLCYRDGSGRKAFGIVDNVQITSTFYGGEARFALTRVDHDEDV